MQLRQKKQIYATKAKKQIYATKAKTVKTDLCNQGKNSKNGSLQPRQKSKQIYATKAKNRSMQPRQKQ